MCLKLKIVLNKKCWGWAYDELATYPVATCLGARQTDGALGWIEDLALSMQSTLSERN